MGIVNFTYPIHILPQVYISCLNQILTIIWFHWILVKQIKKIALKIWYATFFLDGILGTILRYSNYRAKIGLPVLHSKFQQPNQMRIRDISKVFKVDDIFTFWLVISGIIRVTTPIVRPDFFIQAPDGAITDPAPLIFCKCDLRSLTI